MSHKINHAYSFLFGYSYSQKVYIKKEALIHLAFPCMALWMHVECCICTIYFLYVTVDLVSRVDGHSQNSIPRLLSLSVDNNMIPGLSYTIIKSYLIMHVHTSIHVQMKDQEAKAGCKYCNIMDVIVM